MSNVRRVAVRRMVSLECIGPIQLGDALHFSEGRTEIVIFSDSGKIETARHIVKYYGPWSDFDGRQIHLRGYIHDSQNNTLLRSHYKKFNEGTPQYLELSKKLGPGPPIKEGW
ncbi:hypothetical protein KA107_02310 [Candidatus Pacearchaeota archaeon]|nr:hypothetical protein [Candidatus Pacearchaeota archaeon]